MLFTFWHLQALFCFALSQWNRFDIYQHQKRPTNVICDQHNSILFGAYKMTESDSWLHFNGSKIMIIGDVWQPSGKNGRFLLSKHFLQHHIQAWPISRQKFCSWWFSNIQSWKKSFPRHHSFEKIMENIPWDYVFKMPTFFPSVLISLKI